MGESLKWFSTDGEGKGFGHLLTTWMVDLRDPHFPPSIKGGLKGGIIRSGFRGCLQLIYSASICFILGGAIVNLSIPHIIDVIEALNHSGVVSDADHSAASL